MKNYHFSHSKDSFSSDLVYCACVECGHPIQLKNPCLKDDKLIYFLYCPSCNGGEETYVVFDLTKDELKDLFMTGIPILEDECKS